MSTSNNNEGQSYGSYYDKTNYTNTPLESHSNNDNNSNNNSNTQAHIPPEYMTPSASVAIADGSLVNPTENSGKHYTTDSYSSNEPTRPTSAQHSRYSQSTEQSGTHSVGGMVLINPERTALSGTQRVHLEAIQNVPALDPQIMPPLNDILAKASPYLHCFDIKIVQQPIRARMCGSSDKDWRPISPPPVLKLTVYDHNGVSVIDNAFMQHLVIHTTLWKDDKEEELTVVELPHNTNSKRISAAAKSRKRGVTQFGSKTLEPGLELEKNLLGDYTASSSIVEDENGQKGCFFVFPSLSVRLEGRYRLRFALIKLPSMDDYQQPMLPTCMSYLFSEPFDVYSIKTFPGMIESTALSKALAHQGIKIPIRNTQDSSS